MQSTARAGLMAKAKAKPKPKKKKKRGTNAPLWQRGARSPEDEEDDFRTFNLQRFNPEAHRLQNAEYELLLDTARHLYRTLSPEEIKKFLSRPTWALRKWSRENLQQGHFTWREELSLLEVMRGNDYQGEYINSEVTDSDSEDDEPIASVCRERPAGDGRQSKDSDEEPIASLLLEALHHHLKRRS